MRYLLDTNTCSHILGNHRAVIARLAGLPSAATLFTSVVAQGEMLYGAYHAPDAQRPGLLNGILRVVALVAEVLPVTDQVADRYGRVRAQLAAQGTPIPVNDVWTAAIALEAGLIVVSDDTHFHHVPGLSLENWLE